MLRSLGMGSRLGSAVHYRDRGLMQLPPPKPVRKEERFYDDRAREEQAARALLEAAQDAEWLAGSESFEG